MHTNNISIAMAYHNRLSQTRKTLSQIESYGFNGEIIICDDFSTDEFSAQKLIQEFTSLDIKVVHPTYKKVNPCFAYNIALKACTKDVVIIQNPECCWVGDIAEFLCLNLSQNDYFSFACKWVDHDESLELLNAETTLSSVKGKMWINHSKIDPRGMHWCAALFRKDLDEKLFGGFDERFADGVWYDDNEFLFRVKQELNFKIIDDPYVLHQFHSKSWETALPKPRAELIAQNKKLFDHTIEFYKSESFQGVFPRGLVK